MILDTLAASHRYAGFHPLFSRAFEFLRGTNLAGLAPGRHAIDGDRVFVLIEQTDGRGHDAARLESHRIHTDIQFVFDGEDEIGWKTLADCRQPGTYDAMKDLIFYDDRPDTWIAVPRGHFAIFFPDDAHAPLAGRRTVGKAVVKVRTSSNP
jgi:biofilm protein TabA